MIFGDGTAPLSVAEQTELLELCTANNDISVDCKIILRGSIEQSSHCRDSYGYVRASVLELFGLPPYENTTPPEEMTWEELFLGDGQLTAIREEFGCPTY